MQLFPIAIYLMLQRCPALLSCQFLVGSGDIVPANKLLTLHHLTTLKLVAHAVVKWDNLLRLLVKYPTIQFPYLTITCSDVPGIDRARRRYRMMSEGMRMSRRMVESGCPQFTYWG
jgi:hypothetical protein